MRTLKRNDAQWTEKWPNDERQTPTERPGELRMTKKPNLSTRRQLELMQQLQELADARARSETEVAETLATELATAQSDYETTASRLTEEFAQRRRQLENDFAKAKKNAGDTQNQTHQRLQKAFYGQQAKSEAAYKQSALAIERKKKESEWQVLAVFDAAKDGPQLLLDQAGKRLLARRQQVDGLQRDANTLLAMRHLLEAAESIEPLFETESEQTEGEASHKASHVEEQQQANLNQLHRGVLSLQSQRLPSVLLEGVRPWGWWLATCVGATLALGTLVDWSLWKTPLLGLIAGSGVAGVVYLLIGGKAKQQSMTQYARILGLLQQADTLEQAAQNEARDRSRREAEKINQAKHQDLTAAQAMRDRAVDKNDARKQAEAEHIGQLLEEELATAKNTHVEALAKAETTFPPQLDQLAEQRQTQTRQNTEHFEQRKKQAQATHDAAWLALAERWREGFQAVTNELAAMRKACERLFPDWSTTEWNDWQRPTEPPPAMQFGSCRLPLSVVKNGLSDDPRLRPEQTEIELPALMPFDELPRLVVSAEGVGRKAAVDVLQAMMLRFLTTIPAGKLRFTIIDPSALGENFATFMHLADYDEQLVGTRIWTDAGQIDERLSLLSDHMEKVLQKYLRNEFATLQEYNQQLFPLIRYTQGCVIQNPLKIRCSFTLFDYIK